MVDPAWRWRRAHPRQLIRYGQRARARGREHTAVRDLALMVMTGEHGRAAAAAVVCGWAAAEAWLGFQVRCGYWRCRRLGGTQPLRAAGRLEGYLVRIEGTCKQISVNQ